MIENPALQCEANIDHWAIHHGFNIPRPFKAEQDRCWYEGLVVANMVSRLVEDGKLVAANYKNHGATAVAGWREARTKTTVQICRHVIADRQVFEIDFDLWHPWDGLGLLGHAWEVFTNRLARRKTDPYKVARRLKERGIYAV